MSAVDHELEFLLSLDGSEFRFARGYVVKLAAHAAEATAGGLTASNIA
jgi:hypothetical protein